jgi:2OG-Fe(II) oxygenase superfamily
MNVSQATATMAEQFQRSGYVLFNKGESPLSPTARARLEDLAYGDQSRFALSTAGDTNEEAFVRVHRLLHDGNPPRPADPVLMEQVMEIIGAPAMIEFYENALGRDNLMIRRAQAHIITTGGHIGRHRDDESSPHYFAAVILMFRSADEGGDFLVFGDDGTARAFNHYDMIITAAELPHEVERVEAGERRSLAFWLADVNSPA